MEERELKAKGAKSPDPEVTSHSYVVIHSCNVANSAVQAFSHSINQIGVDQQDFLPRHFSFHLGIEYDQNVIKCPSRQAWVQCRRR